MKHDKDFYRNIKHNGFEWFGYADKKHHFKKKENNGFFHVKVLESDITDGSVEFMLNNLIGRH